MSKETYICQKRHIFVKRDVHFPKETCTRATCDSTQRAHGYSSLCISLCTSKETYICQKRHTFVKRDVHLSKETYICQKRPAHEPHMTHCAHVSCVGLCGHMYVCNTRLFVVLHVCLCWSLLTYVVLCGLIRASCDSTPACTLLLLSVTYTNAHAKTAKYTNTQMQVLTRSCALARFPSLSLSLSLSLSHTHTHTHTHTHNTPTLTYS